MSFFFDVTDGNETFRAGLHGGMGINTMAASFLDKYNLSYECRNDFLKAMDRLNEDKTEWCEFNVWCKQNMLDMVKKENNK